MLWLLTGLTASADGLDLGVGVRNSLTEANMVEGGRLIVRWDAGAWALEGSGYGSPVTERINDLDHILVTLGSEINDEPYSRTVGVDQASASGLLTWRGVAPAEGLSGGPALYLGGELSRQVLYTIDYGGGEAPNTVTDEGLRLVPAPILGVGLEVSQARLSGRFSVLDRVRILDGEAEHEPTLTLDILWRL